MGQILIIQRKQFKQTFNQVYKQQQQQNVFAGRIYFQKELKSFF
jgi:hypothetical protein